MIPLELLKICSMLCRCHVRQIVELDGVSRAQMVGLQTDYKLNTVPDRT